MGQPRKSPLRLSEPIYRWEPGVSGEHVAYDELHHRVVHVRPGGFSTIDVVGAAGASTPAPDGLSVALDQEGLRSVRFSPDGMHFAFVCNKQCLGCLQTLRPGRSHTAGDLFFDFFVSVDIAFPATVRLLPVVGASVPEVSLFFLTLSLYELFRCRWGYSLIAIEAAAAAAETHLFRTDAAESIDLFDAGLNVERDDAKWQYALVLPLKTDATHAKWMAPMPDAVKCAETLFNSGDGWASPGAAIPEEHPELSAGKFFDGMSYEEFQTNARAILSEILTGPSCGFTISSHCCSSKDKLLLLIRLERPDAIQQLAQVEELRVPLRPSRYEEMGLKIPVNPFDDEPLTHHARFTMEKSHVFTEFSEVQLLRLVKRRLWHVLNIEELHKAEVMTEMFPVHHWKDILEFWNDGFSNPARVLQYPGRQHTTKVRNYFGEEVAFFYHWFNFVTRCLFVPGILWAVSELLLSGMGTQLGGKQVRDTAFAGFMCLWSGSFRGLYTQRSNLKSLQWGMADYFQVASVLPSYRAELRGSYSEFGWRALGWAVACLCLVETLVVVWYITFVRAQAFLHPDQRFTFLGIHAQTIESYGNILITANIKVMDPLLSAIITAINKRENWRTEQMSKDSKIKKLFIVKFIVNYYPQ
ncbi:unnamed protein product, partial [Polarella glacialis]